MREELFLNPLAKIRNGITPAHAGRIRRQSAAKRGYEDHPRACGKNPIPPIKLRSTIGSPPRMREESEDIRDWNAGRRITPAHAGRISIKCIIRGRSRDHPRACGKNLLPKIDIARSSGSPPRMREELDCTAHGLKSTGITPAHAGRIIGRNFCHTSFQDHPRACGKNESTVSKAYSTTGSPPRMREEFLLSSL